MKKEDTVYIKEIIEIIELIENSLKEKIKQDLMNDLNLRDATIRRIEIIGEATKNISKEVRNKHPEVTWKKIAGTRDNVIHRYFNVDLEIIWNIVSENIPQLKKQMNDILKDLEKQNNKNNREIKS
jgi:uncharacterized protein with HEPN domain